MTNVYIVIKPTKNVKNRIHYSPWQVSFGIFIPTQLTFFWYFYTNSTYFVLVFLYQLNLLSECYYFRPTQLTFRMVFLYKINLISECYFYTKSTYFQNGIFYTNSTYFQNGIFYTNSTYFQNGIFYTNSTYFQNAISYQLNLLSEWHFYTNST